MLHQRYIELAKRVVSQLQQFDSMMRDAMCGRPESTPGEEATTSTSKQFDNHGLPLAPQPARTMGRVGTISDMDFRSSPSAQQLSRTAVLNARKKAHGIKVMGKGLYVIPMSGSPGEQHAIRPL